MWPVLPWKYIREHTKHKLSTQLLLPDFSWEKNSMKFFPKILVNFNNNQYIPNLSLTL